MKSIHAVNRPDRPVSIRQIPARANESRRQGKVLALFAVSLPVMLAVAGLVLDGGEMLNESRIAQHATDAAASAAAKSLQDGATLSEAIAIAEEYIHDYNELSAADVDVWIPPVSGPLTGDAQSVEVEIRQPSPRHFLSFVGGSAVPEVRTRAVARYKPVTAGAALVVLDPDPPSIGLPALPGVLWALPPLVAGVEVLGTASFRIDGAVHVNTTWGGVDEEGNPAGESAPAPWGIACPDLSFSQKLRARDIRVGGGVDVPSHYGHFTSGEPSPLKASRLPVPDPLIDVPVPTFASDPNNVVGTEWGGVSIDDPWFSSTQTLEPGVYDWLEITSGSVEFDPGVYIIRSVNPVTGIALNITGGWVEADDVLFYVTDSAGYSPGSGAPDSGDGETAPPFPGVSTLVPSIVINSPFFFSEFRGLKDPGSPYDGMLIFQRRADRRPIVVVSDWFLGGEHVRGTIYAKWGQVVLAGRGFQKIRVAAGTLRLLTIGTSRIAPSDLLPPAEDVVLAE